MLYRSLASAVEILPMKVSRFRLGYKTVSSHGFLVAMNAEDAVQTPAHAVLTTRYTVWTSLG